MQLTIRLERDLKNLLKLEHFIRNLKSLPDNQKNRLIIISSELFDNIVQHTINGFTDVTIRFYLGKVNSMLVLFHSRNMNVYMTNVHNSRLYFDEKTRKYRGIGIKMCYNLSASIHYRVTQNYNAILVRV